jgi:hypothetical protein
MSDVKKIKQFEIGYKKGFKAGIRVEHNRILKVIKKYRR